MQPAVIARALAVIAVAATGWSLNVKWGTGSAIRGGPPMQWERMVVGAAALAFLSAFLVWWSTRTKPSQRVAGLAIAAATGPGLITWRLSARAARDDISQVLGGPGFKWLMAGAGVTLIAAILALVSARQIAASPKSPERKSKTGRRKR